MASADDTEDFGDSFGESMASPDGRAGGGASGGTRIANQRFDEAYELSGDLDESVDTHAQSMSMASPGVKVGAGAAAAMSSGRGVSGADTPPKAVPVDEGEPSGYPPDDVEIPPRSKVRGRMRGDNDDDDDEEEEEDTEEEGDEEQQQDGDEHDHHGAAASMAGMTGGAGQATLATPAALASAAAAVSGAGAASGADDSSVAMPRGYDPADYSGLRVSKEISELFEHIGRYSPHVHELPTRLKPFIPDFMPSVGDIDPILKPERPDGVPESLGFTKLDEPSPHQSDATVLELQLRALSKKSHLEPTFVRSIPEADKNPREIQKWIESVEELHRSKPPPQVRYSKPMPDVEALMQEWPEQIEALLATVDSPSADLDLSLEEFSRVACALTGVPVHSSETLVQSLHVLFTLYAEFRANQHFQVGGGGDGPAAAAAASFAADF